MKLIEAPSSDYCEIYQDTSLKFAIAVPESRGVVRQVHDFIKCRDFLNEAVYASKLRIDSPKIYGFSYPAGKYPFVGKTLRMILKGTDFPKLESNLHLLNDFEISMGWKATTITKIAGHEDKRYLRASSIWTRGSVPISLYTHIIRCLYQYKNYDGFKDLISFLRWIGEKGQGNTKDYQSYINEAGVEDILYNVNKVFSLDHLPKDEGGFSLKKNLQYIHNYGGIVAFSKAVRDRESDIHGLFKKQLKKYYSLVPKKEAAA